MTAASFFAPELKIISTGCRRAAIGMFVLMAVFSSRAALLMEDAITNAAVGSNLGSAAPWGNSAGQIKVASGNLVYSGLLSPTNTGNLANLLGTAGGSSYRAFTGAAVTSGTVYYSFDGSGNFDSTNPVQASWTPPARGSCW